MPLASSRRWFAVLTAEAKLIAKVRGIAYPCPTREQTAAINAEAERRLGPLPGQSFCELVRRGR